MLNYQNDVCYVCWYRLPGFNTHSSILYDFINDNDLCVADFTDPQHVQYTYFCDPTATYTWIDHCLTTSQNIVNCNIIPRHADNVSDHLPLCLQTRVLSEQCQPTVLSTDVPHSVTCRWDNLECTNTYHDTLHSKLSTMHILTCDATDDSDAVQGLVDSYVVQLNDAMHDAVTEAGCKQKHCNKSKTYWCPELSHLRDRKRFWWRLWNDNDRPRVGAVYETYKYIKKVFRRRIRQCVDRSVNNKYQKLNVMLKNKKLSAFWNVIKQRKITKVKSSLCATDFGEFYGDVMQALPECTVEQTHDKHMVEQYFSDNCYLIGTHEVHQDQVAMLISKLIKNQSPGLDGITAEHLIYGKSSLLCSLLASLYTIILSRACVPTLFTTGLIVPILKKSTLNANIAKNYRPITLSSIHTKMVEALILPDTDLSDIQFGFRENRGTAFACNLLNDITSYSKSQNSPVFVAALDAEKCVDSICHVSLFLKLIHVLPVHDWLLLYNWYDKLNAVVKWNGSYSKPFDVTRGTRQGSVLSTYLFNIFINQLLLDLNNCDAGVRIGDTLYNSMAYADDITLFSTNVQDLQNLIDVCDAYSKRWKFKFGVEKSKCMIVGKCPLYQDPKWRLGDKCLCNEESLNILGNVFNQGGNNASHVTNRLTKCRQSFYGLGNAGMLYPGAIPGVQAYLYKCICQPTLTYGLECMGSTAIQMRRLEFAQGKLIKQSLGLSKLSHNTALLKALNIEKIEDIVNRNVLSLYSKIFKVESPARRLMQHLLSRFICYGETIPGTLLDRVVSMGESPIKRAFNYQHVPQSSATNDGLVDSIRHLLFTDNFNRPYSHEHLLVHLLTTAL